MRQSLTGALRWRMVLANTSAEPMTNGRHSRLTAGRASAFTMTSGPIPAGSPMVMPRKGFMAVYFTGSWPLEVRHLNTVSVILITRIPDKSSHHRIEYALVQSCTHWQQYRHCPPACRLLNKSTHSACGCSHHGGRGPSAERGGNRSAT